jgi:hypothetical protein
MVHVYTQLKNARFMGLSTLPSSKVAHKLCNVVTDHILKHESRVRARRAKDQANFEHAVGLIMGDLLAAAVSDEAGWAYRSVSKKSFTDSNIKGDTFNTIMDSLGALGYLDKVLGGNLKSIFATGPSNSFNPGMATRFKATKALLSVCQDSGFELAAIKEHFKRRPSLQEIRLKGTSSRVQRVKISAKPMRFEQTDVTRAIRERLLAANTFLVGQSYQGMDFYGLRRIFNEGDHPSFNWNLGGRLYGVGEDNYQMLKKAKRLDIKINGEAVVELDINASYLRILHGLRRYPLPPLKDIYAIKGGVDRALIKAWVSSTLGHTSFHRSWSPGVMSELKKAGVRVGRDASYPNLQPKVLAHFPVLSDWPEGKVRWSHLMYEEAEAMMSTMEGLRLEGVAALPVHDSLIVPKSKGLLAMRIMKETFESRFDVEFVVSGLK